MAGDGDADPHLKHIQAELRRIEQDRIPLEQERDRLLDQLAHHTRQQISLHPQPPAVNPRWIHMRLRLLATDLYRLDDKKEDLLRRERIHNIRLAQGSARTVSSRGAGLGSRPAGSSRGPGSTGSAPRIRQSVLYSAPRRSRGRTRRPVEEHAGELSTGEVESTSMDLSNLEALTLNTTPPTLESDDRVVMHADSTESGALDSTISQSSAPEEQKPRYEVPQKYWPPFTEGEKVFARIEEEEKQAQLAVLRGRPSKAFKEELAKNAKKWMSEEAMVAFKRYVEKEDDLKEVEYEFDELVQQCFNVEHYFKIFHHLNFTVKMRRHGSADWTSVMYFAEVREIHIFGIKTYVCYPLNPDENGECYACQNQGMLELRHPLVGLYDCGTEATEFPYYSEDSDSEELPPKMGEGVPEVDMFDESEHMFELN